MLQFVVRRMPPAYCSSGSCDRMIWPLHAARLQLQPQRGVLRVCAVNVLLREEVHRRVEEALALANGGYRHAYRAIIALSSRLLEP